MLVEGGIKVQEVGEESPCRHLARQTVQVVVAVIWQIAHAPFLLPNLYGEDGSLAVAHALVGAVEQFAYHATPFGRGVRTVVDGREHYLVSSTRVDGVHVVDEGFHRLVNACHGAVDGMLLDACIAFQSVEWAVDVVVYLSLVQVFEVVTIEIFQIFHLFYIRGAHEGGEIEVEGRDGLSTVHLVLCALQGDARQHGGCLDALGGSGRAVSSGEPML